MVESRFIGTYGPDVSCVFLDGTDSFVQVCLHRPIYQSTIILISTFDVLEDSCARVAIRSFISRKYLSIYNLIHKIHFV